MTTAAPVDPASPESVVSPAGSSNESSEAAAREITRMQALLEDQRAAYGLSPMPSADERQAWLTSLRDALKSHEEALIAAISADFGHRSAHETRLAELVPSYEGIRHARRHLKGWMKPSKRHVSAAFQPASARVVYQPLGVVGIIVPWNYPLYLAIGPLISALSAGNRVMIKMSEFTPETAEALRVMLLDAFDEVQVAVVIGEADVAAAFSALPFDHLLFTGSTAVGKHVMRAAADNLTPVTLELGGKSPVIMSRELMADESQRREAAGRLAFGKGMNAGQTCVAPDYVLCSEDQVPLLVTALGEAFQRFYPRFCETQDYSRIINQRQYQRLREVLEDALAKGATLRPLVDSPDWNDPELVEKRLMPPLALLDVTDEMRVMQEEIFGPVLPVKTYRHIDEAIDYVNDHDRPLGLYFFGQDSDEREKVLSRTISGGVTINDVIFHVSMEDLPFGGVGPSGMGSYHGVEGFREFSHARSIYTQPKIDVAKLGGFKPPYGPATEKAVKTMMK
ncbi:MAG TPA: coniferyl-aldehyde dehydrogenase [Cobetia sp.]|nr:coniferyl-aldehyde dehydrogenase [Cobetia sp.]